MADLYSKVPKEPRKNLEYRLALRKRAEQDAGFRKSMLQACKGDVLFFINSFASLYEPRPRKGQPNVIPFITWPHQDPVIRLLDEHLGYRDIGGDKSRGEGASWIAVMMALHRWLFYDMTTIGIVSRNEEACDKPDDPGSCGWKIDWELTKLPKWMAGERDKEFKRNLKDHTWANLRNGSVITGYAATGDVASGGRTTFFIMDELAKYPRPQDREAMASTQYVTDSRLIISTPKGREGAYAEIMREDSHMLRFTLDWKDNPTRNRGLYRLVKGEPVAVDENNPLPPDYNPLSAEIKQRLERLRRRGFNLEGGIRSPWYDEQCDRPQATPSYIARELDRNFGGSVQQYFTDSFFKQADEGKRPPLLTGRYVYSRETLEGEFQDDKTAELYLWCKLDTKGAPPRSAYTIGADPSFGHGGAFTNNAALSIFDNATMEQVGEFTTQIMPPEQFAELTIAIAKWFWGAFVIFEANGPGVGFAKRLLSRHYGNVYYRTDELLNAKKSTKQRKIGWWSSPDNLRIVLGQFSDAVKCGECTLRSDRLVRECNQYEIKDGEIVNAASMHTDDDASKRHSHADRVIAAALALHGIKHRPVLSNQRANQLIENPRYGSLAWREKFHRDRLAEESSDWDDRTNDDIANGTRTGAIW